VRRCEIVALLCDFTMATYPRALATVLGVTMFVREIRLLVKACFVAPALIPLLLPFDADRDKAIVGLAAVLNRIANRTQEGSVIAMNLYC